MVNIARKIKHGQIEFVRVLFFFWTLVTIQ